MDASHQSLLYHTEVRWLSKGNLLLRICELLDGISQFLYEQDKLQWGALFGDDELKVCVCYLADIFERLNTLNLSLQGKACYLLDFCGKLSRFQGLIDHWLRKA